VPIRSGSTDAGVRALSVALILSDRHQFAEETRRVVVAVGVSFVACAGSLFPYFHQHRIEVAVRAKAYDIEHVA
jgi:hypothetical protein